MENVGKLVHIELDDDDKIDGAIVHPTGKHVPDYPYGQRLSFDHSTLKKLGMVDDLASGGIEVGDTLHLRGLGKVTHISHDESGHRMEVQMTHYFEPVEDEDKE